LANGQIAFPATQVASANANTLDDYEEGTWTPVMTFATPGNLSISAYGVQAGAYTKIGRSATLSFNISISAGNYTQTTASGSLQTTGHSRSRRIVYSRSELRGRGFRSGNY
jgi:hypothetical protein